MAAYEKDHWRGVSIRQTRVSGVGKNLLGARITEQLAKKSSQETKHPSGKEGKNWMGKSEKSHGMR